MEQYIVEEQQSALKLDALENTHAIEVSVSHPDEIRTIFDAISYNKGGSSIMMLSQYLGADTFRDGLRYYLKQHAYKNTDTIDLWNALEKTSKKPVASMMEAWTSQPGYPVVKATVDHNHVHLSQEQFFINPRARRENTVERLWPIALKGTGNSPEVLNSRTADFDSDGPEALKLNCGQTGFFRVIYNPEHVRNLGAHIDTFSAVDRLGILGDAFEAAKAGYSDTISALSLLETYRDESDVNVWDVIAQALGTIRHIMDDEALRTAMNPYCNTLISAQLTRLGWDTTDKDSHFDKLLRPTILGMASAAENDAVIAEAQKRFIAITKSEDLNPDIRGIVYSTVARHGDEKTFEKLLELHNTSSSPEERVTLSAALTNFRQPELIDRALGLITTDTVRLQDAMYWVAYSFSNRFAREATWQWIQKNWQWLKDNLGSDTSFTRLPVYTARVMGRADFLKEYTTFFESVMEPAIDRSYKQGLEMIEWQSAWRERDLEALKSYFSNHK